MWNGRKTLVLAAAVSLSSATFISAATESQWLKASSGDWTNAANWSSNPNYPNNGSPDPDDLYDAVIQATGSYYVVSLRNDVDLNRLSLSSANAVLSHDSGTLEVLTADLLAGTYQLNGGTIHGGTWNAAPGVFQVTASTANRIDDVTWNGNISLAGRNSYLGVQNGLRLNGTADLTGSNSQIEFLGIQEFATGTIKLGTSTRLSVNSGAQLTIGTGAKVQGAGGTISATGEIINRGLLQSTSGLTVQASAMTNEGTIETTGSSLNLKGTWTNSTGGVIRATNGTLTLSGSWQNLGTIEAANSTVNLGGTFTRQTLGQFNRTGGQVNVQGVFDNSTEVMTFNSATGSWYLAGGTIRGGTLRSADGQTLNLTTSGGTLDGVIADLPLNLSTTYASVRLANGTRADQGISLTGQQSKLIVNTGQVLDHTTVTASPVTNGTSLSVEGTGVLTFGPDLFIHGGAHTILSGTAGAELVNQGRIAADLSSKTLTVRPDRLTNEGLLEALNGGKLVIGGAWTNRGTLRVDATSTLSLGGTFTTADIGTIERAGGSGTVAISGTLNNSGNVFSLDSVHGPLLLTYGTIVGGTIVNPSGHDFRVPTGEGATFDGVTLATDLRASAPVTVKNNLTLDNSNLYLTSILCSGSSQIAGSGRIVLGNSSQLTCTGAELAIGPGITVETTGSTIRGDHAVRNNGQISVSGQNSYLYLEGSPFINDTEGRIEATNSSKLRLQGQWSNKGSIRLVDSNLNLGGTFTPADLGHIERVGNTTVQLTGQMDNTGNDFVLDDSTGSWQLVGGTIKGGTVRVEGAAALGFTTSAYDGGGTLDGATYLGNLSLGKGIAHFKNGASATEGLTISGGTAYIENTTPFENWTVSFETTPEFGWSQLVLSSSVIGAHTVLQGGDFHVSGTRLENQGRILADCPSELAEVYSDLTNKGVIRASNGAYVTLSAPGAGVINAPGGLIESTDSRLDIELVRNEGNISVTNSDLTLYGKFNLGDLGTIHRTGGNVYLGGELDVTGQTLTLDSQTGSWALKQGTIKGGVVEAKEGARLLVAGGGTLNGTTLRTDVTLENTSLTLLNGLTLDNGKITLACRDDSLSAGLATSGAQQIGGTGEIVFADPIGNSYASSFLNSGGTSLTLGTGIWVHGNNGQISGLLVNDGRISADVSGGKILLASTLNLTNNGTIEARNGGQIQISSAGVIKNLANGTLSGGVWAAYAGSKLDFGGRQISCINADVTLSGQGSIITGLEDLNRNAGLFTLDDTRDFSTRSSFANQGQLYLGEGSIFSVLGDYTDGSSSVLTCLLSPEPQLSGLLNVSGTAYLSGTVGLVLSDPALFHQGDRFAIVRAGNMQYGTLMTDFPDLPAGLRFELDCATDALYVSVVPEPAAIVLALLGAAVLISSPRRRRPG